MSASKYSACFTWGIHKGLGLQVLSPIMIPKDIGNINYISIGKNHIGLINSSGSLFTYGNNSYYQLPHKATIFPTEVLLSSVVQVQCGNTFTIALNAQGELFSWGSAGSKGLWSKIVGKRHSLGINTNKDIKTPTKIEMSEEIKEIACGTEHCLALGKFNVYSWGINDFGQLGQGNVFNFEPKPKLLKFPLDLDEQIIKIFAGEHSSGAISNKGKGFIWGSNKGYQLGLGEAEEMILVPVLLPITEIYTIKDMYIGANSLMVITDTDDVFAVGLDYWKTCQKFEIPGGLDPVQVCCGEDYFAVLCEDNKIVYYGGIFSKNPEFLDLPERVEVMTNDFIPGNITRIEGKYGFMGAISLID